MPKKPKYKSVFDDELYDLLKDIYDKCKKFEELTGMEYEDDDYILTNVEEDEMRDGDFASLHDVCESISCITGDFPYYLDFEKEEERE